MFEHIAEFWWQCFCYRMFLIRMHMSITQKIWRNSIILWWNRWKIFVHCFFFFFSFNVDCELEHIILVDFYAKLLLKCTWFSLNFSHISMMICFVFLIQLFLIGIYCSYYFSIDFEYQFWMENYTSQIVFFFYFSFLKILVWIIIVSHRKN